MTKIERLEIDCENARVEWLRACNYASQVATEAQKRFDWVYLSGPARRRFERAYKKFERAKK
jgi:hypothetical protein